MSISSETKFIGISPDVSVEQKRSTQINDQSEGYTASEIIGAGLGYKVYTALLTQTGTNAPVATVLQNTFDDDFVWAYEGIGGYSVSNAEITQNTITFFGANGGNNTAQSSSTIANQISYVVSSPEGMLDNGLLTKCPIEIRLYI